MRNQTRRRKDACPKCGGQMKLLEFNSGKKLVCDYCGYEAAPARERTPEEQAQVRERRRLRIQKRALAAAKRRRRAIIIAAAAAAAAFLVTFFIIRSTAQQTADPFAYATVTFSGGNGKGEAELWVHDGGTVDTSKIRYMLSQSYGLYEGDIITLEAESSEYQLTSRKKEFTVEGLDTYLTDLDSLSDQAIDMIHAKSESVNKKNTERSADIVHDCVSCEPVRMYLLTDEANRNLLYDVYEAGFAMEHDDIQTVYLVTFYENLIVRDGSTVSMDYGRCYYDGKALQFGESIFHTSTVIGYDSLEEIETAMQANQDETMHFKQRDTSPEEEEEE